MAGPFTNANPIYATSEVDAAVSKLLFSGLMSYNAQGNLVGDLAVSVTPDASGKVYTVVLRDDVRWHDGHRLTSQDVVFTYQTIQNPDAKSSLFSGWQGIVVSAPDSKTVVFTLPNIYAPFPYSLTNGILPEHLLSKADVGSLRSALFNTTQPVGTGPFKWNRVEVRGDKADEREQRVSLKPYDGYYDGRPKLNEFVIRVFLNENLLTSSFDRGELNAMAGVQDLSDADKKDLEISQYNIPVSGAVMIFFRTTQGILADVNVRKALAAATDQQEIIKRLSYPSIASNGPFLRGMVGNDPLVKQQGFDLATANSLLDTAGWVRGPDGVRIKGGQKLSLTLNTLSTLEYAASSSLLQKQWQQVGVELVVASLSQKDLQSAIDNRSYDILLYGISLGQDPDQFAYWHSSQADVHASRRLNFSDYKSAVADSALETGRTRIDPSLRAAKYRPFLDAWRADVPAISLFQPRFLYITKGAVFNFNNKTVNSPSDRYTDVEEWMVRTERHTND